MQKYFISIEQKNNQHRITSFIKNIIKLGLILCFVIGFLYIGFYLMLFFIIFFSVSYIMNAIRKL